MKAISIQQVRLSEVEKLQWISKTTFQETFSEHNKEEDMITYLEKNLSIDKLTSELSDPNSAFYFARTGQQVIGYLGSAEKHKKINSQ